jgi:ATP adenylyltransferase
MTQRSLLFSPDKLGYVQGDRPRVDCIFCASRDLVPGVDHLIVYRGKYFFVTLNLFPYNPGHVMVVPLRHTETFEDFSVEEMSECFRLQSLCIQVLNEMYHPKGYNLGCNIGESSGASISHFHYHVVPRYRSELGFMDVINGTRIIVESPHTTRGRMVAVFEKFVNSSASK